MTEAQARLAYESLIRDLRENMLGWVADQVAAQVAQGRLVPKRINDDEELGQGRRPRGNNTDFVSSQPYRPSEQLLLLVDALHQVLISATLMQAATLNRLKSAAPVETIVFVSPDQEEGLHRIDELQLTKRTFEAMHLKDLLDEIRTELRDQT